MEITLLVILLCTGAYGVKKPLATDENYLTDLQLKHLQELRCFNRFDAIVASKWTKDFQKIFVNDLREEPLYRFHSMPSKQMYNTVEQQWLLESGSTSKEIESCLRSFVPEIIPFMSDDEIECLNYIFDRHIKGEMEHENIHKKKLKDDVREQLPFRMYISFTEFVELMFQNRNPDALGDRERGVYEHAESFLSTENDHFEPTYIVQNECSWKNAKALREAPNADARFDEFLRQVQDSVDKHLGSAILDDWDMNQTLSRDKYLSWLEASQKTTSKIYEEVTKLRTQNNDAQWLCDYAAQLAYKFWSPQSTILVENRGYRYLEASEFLNRIKNIEKFLEEDHDIRYPVLKTLVNKYENTTSCLSAFYHLIEQHQRFNIASAFASERYTYPEFYCTDQSFHLVNIKTEFCKCVGSFCVRHGIAILQKEEYELLQKPDGTYYVAVSEIGKERRLKEAEWIRNCSTPSN